MDLIIINGYARSGKTTALEYFRDKYNYSVYSTSNYLHEVSARLLNLYRPKVSIEEFKNILADKDNGVVIFGTQEYEVREFLVKIAEEVLVPVFSRKIFSSNIIWNLIKDRPKRAVVETIGGQEWLEMKQVLDYNKIQYRVLVLRSHREKAGIDIREIINEATIINNDSSCLKSLYSELDSFVTNKSLVS